MNKFCIIIICILGCNLCYAQYTLPRDHDCKLDTWNFSPIYNAQPGNGYLDNKMAMSVTDSNSGLLVFLISQRDHYMPIDTTVCPCAKLFDIEGNCIELRHYPLEPLHIYKIWQWGAKVGFSTYNQPQFYITGLVYQIDDIEEFINHKYVAYEVAGMPRVDFSKNNKFTKKFNKNLAWAVKRSERRKSRMDKSKFMYGDNVIELP